MIDLLRSRFTIGTVTACHGTGEPVMSCSLSCLFFICVAAPAPSAARAPAAEVPAPGRGAEAAPTRRLPQPLIWPSFQQVHAHAEAELAPAPAPAHATHSRRGLKVSLFNSSLLPAVALQPADRIPEDLLLGISPKKPLLNAGASTI